MRYATVVVQRALVRLLGGSPRTPAKPVRAVTRDRAPQPQAIGTLASIAAVGVVAAAASRAPSALASPPDRGAPDLTPASASRPDPAGSPPTQDPERPHRDGRAAPRAPQGGSRAMNHVPGTVRRVPTTRAQLAMARPPGTPGAVPPPLRRAAPDRTIWRAPEFKDLPPDIAADESWSPGAHWRTAPTDPRFDRMFARRAAPRPTAHRTPSGFTRRSWRRYEPVSLGLSAEELGLTLPAVVDPASPGAASQPSRARAVHAELAGLAIARRTGELVGIPADDEAEGRAAAAALAHVVAEPEPELAALVRPAHARRGRIHTVADDSGAVDLVAVDLVAAAQPAGVRRESRLTVVPEHRFDLERARAASARAVVALTGPHRRAERSIAGGLAVLVMILSFIGVSPLSPASAGTGNVGREASPPARIAIGVFANGGGQLLRGGDSGPDGFGLTLPEDEVADRASAAVSSVDLMPVETANPDPPSLPSDSSIPLADRYEREDETDAATDAQGPFNADGTLVKPIAVDTTVPDGKSQLRTYKVKTGDSASDIARRFKVTTATVVWSNNLVDAPVLKVGQTLVIPPVNGLVHVVKDGDTLSRIARKFNVDFRTIMEANDLTETTVFIGQTLIIPGGRGEHIGTPPAAAGTDLNPANPARSNTVTLPRRTVATAPRTYSGGGFAWPLPGGSISQYYNSGHGGMDIAGPYGLPVLAASDGVVIFAGWKNNGGGWQVWISHGSGLYTTYNHMAGVSVGYGQAVARGQQVGSNGASGWATGPHVHFEVWVGEIWAGGRRVNPGGYL